LTGVDGAGVEEEPAEDIIDDDYARRTAARARAAGRGRRSGG